MDIVKRLVKARRVASSSADWHRALRAEQREFFKPPPLQGATPGPSAGARWRRIMGAVDLEMESGPRARWDF